MNSGETMSEQEKEELSKAQSEIAQIAAENVLGNKQFVKRLLKGDVSAAESAKKESAGLVAPRFLCYNSIIIKERAVRV